MPTTEESSTTLPLSPSGNHDSKDVKNDHDDSVVSWVLGGFETIRTSKLVSCLLACGLYLLIGPSLILLNNSILNGGFPYPILLSFFGVVASFLISHSIVALGIVPLKQQSKIGTSKQQIWNFYMYKIFPISFCVSSTLVTGNLVYLYLSVSFIQMLKAFTPVLTLIVSYLLSLEVNPPVSLLLSLFGISFGTFVAAFGEIHMSLLGVAIMLASEMSEVFKLTLSEILMTLEFSPFETVYYFTPMSSFLMLCAFSVFELPSLVLSGNFHFIFDNFHLFILCGVFGFLVNLLSFFVVQTTNSVTLKALAVSRNAGLVVFCVLFLGDEISSLQTFGYTCSLLCFVWYNQVRFTNPRKKRKEGDDTKKDLIGKEMKIIEENEE